MLVTFYATSRGLKPVAEYLKSLPDDQRAIVARTLFRIQGLGLDEASVSSRQIEGKLWELKIAQHRLSMC